MVYAGGFPLIVCVVALFLYSRLETLRMAKCLGFWTDFYSPRRFWWEGLRVGLVQGCICASLLSRNVSAVAAAAVLVFFYGILVLFFKPYGAEPVPPW